jgi:hypothetical protein
MTYEMKVSGLNKFYFCICLVNAEKYNYVFMSRQYIAGYDIPHHELCQRQDNFFLSKGSKQLLQPIQYFIERVLANLTG